MSIRTILSIASLLFFQTISFGQDLEDSWRSLDTAKSDQSISDIYGDISYQYSRVNSDSAVKYGQLAVDYSLRTSDFSTKRIAVFYLANAYQCAGNNELALKNFRKSYDYSVKLKDQGAIAADLTSIGGVHFQMSKYDKAIENFQTAIRMFKGGPTMTIRDSSNLGACYQYLTNTYMTIGLNEDALDASAEAIALYKKLGWTHKLELMKVSRAFIFSETQGDRVGITLLSEALDYFEPTGDLGNTARIYSNLSPSYRELGLLDSAEYCSTISLGIHQKINSPFGKMYDRMNLGYIFNAKKQYKKADNEFKLSLKIAEELANSDEIVELNLAIAENLYELSKFKEAGHYFNEYARLSKEYNLPELIKKSSQIPFQLEILDKKREVEKLEEEKKYTEKMYVQNKKIKDAQIRQSNTTLISVIIVSVLLLSLLLVYLKKYREKRRANHEKTILLAEIHHRVKNNLQLVSSLLNLQSNSQKDPVIKAAINQGHDRVKAMWLIHQKLYQKEDFSSVKMDEYIQTLVSHTRNLYLTPGKQLELSVDVDPIHLSIDDATAIGLIINELVSNAFKHSNLNQLQCIQLSLKDIGESLELVVHDNGPGLPEGFDMKNSTSYGLKLVQLLGKEIKGKLNWINQNGLRFKLTFQHKSL